MFARHVLRRNFALDNTRTLTRHIQDRVVSTPSWPIPYHNRITRPEPVSKPDHGVMSNNARPICVLDVNMTRDVMNSTVAGRDALAHFENHAQVDSKIITQNDTGNMMKAYCADLVKHLDVANKENKRILATTNLL